MSLRFVLLGHPVAHSLSPVIHHAAYRALGLPHRYELLDAPAPAALAAAVAELRAGRIAGANVTVPWKREALALADRAAPSAADVGAANVLVLGPAGEVVAHNTDVPALALELALGVPELALEIALAAPELATEGVDAGPRPRTALVLGSGGATLAAVAALKEVGARRIGVTARRFDAAVSPSAWPHAEELLRLGAELVAWPPTDPRAFAAFAVECELIVQATSAGMHGAAPGADVADVIPWENVPLSAFAYDLVYNPENTEFLQRARERGCGASGGLGMLVGQAALAFELWLGVAPPREAMQRAALEELARRRA